MGKWKEFADEMAGALGELTLELNAAQEEARYQKGRAEQATRELDDAQQEITALKAVARDYMKFWIERRP